MEAKKLCLKDIKYSYEEQLEYYLNVKGPFDRLRMFIKRAKDLGIGSKELVEEIKGDKTPEERIDITKKMILLKAKELKIRT